MLLVLVGASRWAVSAARPDADSTLTSLTLGCAWAALLFLALAALQPSASPRPTASPTTHLRWAIAGAMLFAGPAIPLFLPTHELDASALTISLALTPIVVAIASRALGTGGSEGIAGRIWPALAAIAGLLLVLVQPTLGDLRTDAALLLAPILTGTGAALFCNNQPSTTPRNATALLGAAILFAIALAAGRLLAGTHLTLSLLAIATDGLMALLGILTLAHLNATRWSSQFTWIPLLVIFEGILIVRPKLTAHWFIGLVLLLLAGIYLLVPQLDESSADTSPVPTLPI